MSGKECIEMHIAEFQQWVKNADDHTQWNLLTTPQLLSHLTEEVGELAQSLNRIYGYAGNREEQLASVRQELTDVLWFLAKIANKFDVDLDVEAQGLVSRQSEWSTATIEEYRGELIAGMRTLDQELAAAKSKLNLK
jgi:NTP pyrophosphatase (non-canonical NTP hydrolase)